MPFRSVVHILFSLFRHPWKGDSSFSRLSEDTAQLGPRPGGRNRLFQCFFFFFSFLPLFHLKVENGFYNSIFLDTRISVGLPERAVCEVASKNWYISIKSWETSCNLRTLVLSSLVFQHAFICFSKKRKKKASRSNDFGKHYVLMIPLTESQKTR